MTADAAVASNAEDLTHGDARAAEGRVRPAPNDRGEPRVRPSGRTAAPCQAIATKGIFSPQPGGCAKSLSITSRRLAPGLDPADQRQPARRCADWRRAALLFARGHTPAEVAGVLGVPLRTVTRNLRQSRRLGRWIAEARAGLTAASGGRAHCDWKLAARLMAYDYSEAEIAERLGCTVHQIRRRWRESADLHRWLDEACMRRAAREVRMIRRLYGDPAAQARADFVVFPWAARTGAASRTGSGDAA